jgi:hypothetical protein
MADGNRGGAVSRFPENDADLVESIATKVVNAVIEIEGERVAVVWAGGVTEPNVLQDIAAKAMRRIGDSVIILFGFKGLFTVDIQASDGSRLGELDIDAIASAVRERLGPIGQEVEPYGLNVEEAGGIALRMIEKCLGAIEVI